MDRMAASPARDDLSWKLRPSGHFRMPRRTRRTTCALLALIIFLIYQLFRVSTSYDDWQVSSYFEPEERHVPMRLPKLLKTLVRHRGAQRRNSDVFFAAANLTAASKMAGLACEMAKYHRNDVHFAIMGFDDLDVDEFKTINGLPLQFEDPECSINFHDARMEVVGGIPLAQKKTAVRLAFRQIGMMIRPRTIIIDSTREEDWFVDVAKVKSEQMHLTLIELPDKTLQDMRWITRLDSGSLNAWHAPSFEVVIHANSHSGNLVKLLQSLAKAQYPSKKHRPTQITIVLDPSIEVDLYTRIFLQQYRFLERSQVKIRRTLSPLKSDAEAAIKFVESFYSVDNDHSVLFLDPGTELSHWYFHYLLYTVLEYRYSLYQSHNADQLYGISLEDAQTDLTGKKTLPVINHKNFSLMRYQAPSPRAALYFSQQWAELHTYYSNKIIPDRAAYPDADFNESKIRKLGLSKEIANSWQKPMIDLARARGYVMLYPSLPEALAIFRNSESPYTSEKHEEDKWLLEESFPDAIVNSDLPVWTDLPMLNLWGEQIDSVALDTEAGAFRSTISTCPPGKYDKDTGSLLLFCDEDGIPE